MTPREMLDAYTTRFKSVDRTGIIYFIVIPRTVQNNETDMSIITRTNSGNIINSLWDNKGHIFSNYTVKQINSISSDLAKYFSEFITFAKSYVHFYPNIMETSADLKTDHGIMYGITVCLEVIKTPMVSGASVVASFELRSFVFDDQDKHTLIFKTVHNIKPGDSGYRKFVV